MIEDADEATGNLLSLLSVQYDKCFPVKSQRMSNDNKSWMTTRILKLMDQRRRTYDCDLWFSGENFILNLKLK